jgi:hypothetical protein
MLLVRSTYSVHVLPAIHRVTVIGLALVAWAGMTGCTGDDESADTAPGRSTSLLATYHPESVEPEGSAAFDGFVRNLKRAALSGQGEHAAHKAKELKGVERAVAEEFCAFTFMVRANRELKYTDRPRYNGDRIIRYAAYMRDKAFTARAQAVLEELDGIVDLESLDPKRIRLYEIACYR